MSLKQDVVVVNEFSVNHNGVGSRGSTPGHFVSRYMAREGATEALAPIRRDDADRFIMRYMAREGAVEHLDAAKGEVADKVSQAGGKGGVAFGYGDVSLSEEGLKAASKDIQDWFVKGHTVMKTVVSFNEEYLRRNKIIEPDFHLQKAGDYRGNIDQMRLRMAIMNGLRRMGAASFSDLRYVGVIQVDTKHVHAHLAMVDAGKGTLAKDGKQRGKLTKRQVSQLRRGIDSYLDEHKLVASLSAAVGYERRNVVSYIKRWAHESLAKRSDLQFLLAALPQDRRMWRASAHTPQMRKANELVSDLVDEQLNAPGSPLPDAMNEVIAYANNRARREGLKKSDWNKIVDQGYKKIKERCVNGVYAFLKSLPQEQLSVRTPMLDAMSMDYKQLVDQAADAKDDLVTFGVRLRSFATRMRYHKDKFEHNRRLAKEWESSYEAGVANDDSRVLHEFYAFESAWHRDCALKYQLLLPRFSDGGQFYDQLTKLNDYWSRLSELRGLRKDSSIVKMKDVDQAEALGQEIYGQSGGGLLASGPSGRAVLDGRIDAMSKRLDQMSQSLSDDAMMRGLKLNSSEDGYNLDEIEDDFAQVKGVDLHHLGFDFSADRPVGAKVAKNFIALANRRVRLANDVVAYLDSTGQGDKRSNFDLDDVKKMHECATEIVTNMADDGSSILKSRLAQLLADRRKELVERSATISLDEPTSNRLRSAIWNEVSHVEDELSEGRESLRELN